MQEYLYKKAIDLAFHVGGRLLSNLDGTIKPTPDELQNSLNHHLQYVKNWSSEITFSDLRQPKQTKDVYIELDLLLYPRSIRIDSCEKINSIPIRNIFEDPETKHVIILGQPGSGKTTSMKFLGSLLLLDEDFLADRFNFPLVLRLRDLNRLQKDGSSGSGRITNWLLETLGLKLEFLEGDGAPRVGSTEQARERILFAMLEELRPLVILDGFDEIKLKKDRDDVLQEIRKLTMHLESASLILTSRTGDFTYSIEGTKEYEVRPMDSRQLLAFATKWLEDERAARDLLKAVKKSPFSDTTIRPLTLAHLCAIYERVGSIPERPKTVYRKIVSLLLQDWDEQRSIQRQSEYAGFEIDRKFEFLSQLAFALTITFSGTTFSRDQLISVYQRICSNYGLPHSQAWQVARELETHTGLFIQAGHDYFEFTHKSLQEYLTAEYIVKLPEIPNGRRQLAGLPNELAIAVAISSSPSDYFATLVLNRLMSSNIRYQFFSQFVARLVLEKPDFNESIRVGIALLALYSLYVQEGTGVGGQLRLFVSDNLANEFEELAGRIFRRVPRSALLACFEKADETQTADGQVVYLLIKKSTMPYGLRESLWKSIQRLPLDLYVRQSFLEALETDSASQKSISKVEEAGEEPDLEDAEFFELDGPVDVDHSN